MSGARKIGKGIALAFCLLALGGLLAPASLRASTLTESAAASDLTAAQTCNGISTLGSLAPQALVATGANSGLYVVSIAKTATREFVLYSASGVPGVALWPSGNWTVNLEVSTPNSNLTWADTCIIRVNSSGVAQATVGSLTGQNTSLGTVGVESQTVSGGSQNLSSTDRIAVVAVLVNGAHAAESVTLQVATTNDVVTTPLSSGNAYTASLSETLSQSDSIARVAGFGRGVTDAPTTSDSVAKSEGFPVTLADSESLSDSLAQQLGVAVTLAESEAVSDSLAQQSAYSRTPSETLAETDSLSRLATFGRAIGESQAVSDSAARSAGYAVQAAESESTSDALARSFGAMAALGESQSVSDSLGQQSAYMRTNSEALAQSDSLARQAAFGRAALEAETLADSLASLYHSGAQAAPLNGARLSPGSSGATLSGQGSGTRLAPHGQGATLGAHGSGTVLRNPQ